MKFTVAFDCDGTLIRDGAMDTHEIVANERIRSFLIILASFKFMHFQGKGKQEIEIWVWSGGGEIWAQQVVRELGISKYVDKIKSKNLIGKDENGHPIFSPDDTPDWAIDDIHACDLGRMNFIVKEK